MRRSILPALLVLLGLSACEPITTPPAVEIALGTFNLESIGNQAVPTTAPCGVFRVLSGTLLLKPEHRAEYRLRYVRLSSGSDMHYEGNGTFVQHGDSIRVTLRGRWSNSADETTHTTTLRFQHVQGLLELRVGAPCDASSIERYRRQEFL